MVRRTTVLRSADLLPIPNSEFADSVILVTGGTGSIGSELVRELLRYQPRALRVFSRGEEKQYYMQSDLAEFPNMRYLIGDVRDRRRVDYAMKGVDYVFHAAAMKHVPASEYNPMEAVKTNVIGTQNVIEAAIENDVKKFVLVSTDKVVNPRNTMGATKLLSEKLVLSANNFRGDSHTLFACVRFGNVMGSSGSVIPTFVRQILENRPLTLTSGEMTRFMMSIPAAADLIIQAAARVRHGETFILKMPAVRIKDLAECIVESYNRTHTKKYVIEPEVTGARIGERLDESLMTEDEASHSYEDDAMFVLPSPYQDPARLLDYGKEYRATAVRSYSSADAVLMSKQQITDLLTSCDLLPW